MSEIVLISNLYLAWYKAQRGKSNAKQVIEYKKNLHENLISLQKELMTGEIKVGDYHYFYIYEPKKRNISAATFGERVLHHAIMNVCHDTFDKTLIYHTYATRRGKGTYAALDRAKIYAGKYKYYAKLDIRKYFDSISHNILKNQLRQMFKEKQLIFIFSKIIDSYQTTEGNGLPIGNLTSQYFANHYLSQAEHFLLEKIKVSAYIRYMDDMLLFSDDIKELKDKVYLFTNFIKQNLELEFKTININKISNGIPFLGYKVFPFKVLLNKRSKKRFKKKYLYYKEMYSSGYWDDADLQRHLMPLFAFVNYADTLNFRKDFLYA